MIISWSTRGKWINTEVLIQQIQTRAVIKSSNLSSGICLLWLGFIFPHFLITPNIESTLFKKVAQRSYYPFFCTLKQLTFGPQWQLQRNISLPFVPKCNLPGDPLQPMESYHPISHYRNHIPKEEHQFLIDRLFGFLLIKQSIYKVLNKYTAVSDASVPHAPTWRALCSYIWNTMESYLSNAKQVTEWFSPEDSLLITRVQSTHHTHTHGFAHSCLGRRVSALCNLAAWEMFVLMSQTHSGWGRDPGFTGL